MKQYYPELPFKEVLCFQLQIAVRDHIEDIDDVWNIVRRGVYVDVTTMCMYSWQAV